MCTRTWLYRCVIPTLRKIRQKELKFKASSGFTVSLCHTQTLHTPEMCSFHSKIQITQSARNEGGVSGFQLAASTSGTHLTVFKAYLSHYNSKRKT